MKPRGKEMHRSMHALVYVHIRVCTLTHTHTPGRHPLLLSNSSLEADSKSKVASKVQLLLSFLISFLSLSI